LYEYNEEPPARVIADDPTSEYRMQSPGEMTSPGQMVPPGQTDDDGR
jgi:hypothetical protein